MINAYYISNYDWIGTFDIKPGLFWGLIWLYNVKPLSAPICTILQAYATSIPKQICRRVVSGKYIITWYFPYRFWYYSSIRVGTWSDIAVLGWYQGRYGKFHVIIYDLIKLKYWAKLAWTVHVNWTSFIGPNSAIYVMILISFEMTR